MNKILSFTDETTIPLAVEIIQTGGLIVFPTDTVYGLACDLWNSDAIEKVFEAKGRNREKALPILIGSMNQLHTVADTGQINHNLGLLMDRFWPGAMTVIVPKLETLPKNLSQFDTVGIRMPDHPRLLDLLNITGPLAVTSANRSGEDNPTTVEEAYQQLSEHVDLFLDGGATTSSVPSTVITSTSDGFSILREGAISQAEIQTLFE